MKSNRSTTPLALLLEFDAQVRPQQRPFVGSGTRVSRGSIARYFELESKFENLPTEWIAKHGIKLSNPFCNNWEPTRARTNQLDFWQQNERQLQKWKITDHISVPIEWETRSTVARNCRAQNLTDHWLVMIYVRLPQKNEGWRYENYSVLKGSKPQTKGDEAGLGKMLVAGLEDAEGLMGDINIEDIVKNLSRAARAIEFELSTGGGAKMVKQTKERLEA